MLWRGHYQSLLPAVPLPLQSLATTTVIVDGKEVVIPAAVAPPVKEIVERVVEVEKVKVSAQRRGRSPRS